MKEASSQKENKKNFNFQIWNEAKKEYHFYFLKVN
jgi:hypothetical protein